MAKSSKDNPGVIAPPPLIFLGFLAVFLLIDWRLSWTSFGAGEAVRFGAAGLFGIGGLWLIAGALRLFRSANTAARPWLPTTAIVADGVYRISRNPMYLGMAMLYAAVAFLADSVVGLVGLLPALVLMHYGVIAREERYLEAKFGDEYRRYKGAVRRWI